MPEIIPVEAKAVVVLRELLKHVVDHEELVIAEDGVNVFHAASKIIHQHATPHNFGLVQC